MHALVLGVVEGLTEFLPVSSTAHLIITGHLLGLAQTAFQSFFEVFIQAGAILAVVFLYAQYLRRHLYLIRQLAFSFVPTAVIGFLLYKIIKTVFFNSNLLIIMALLIVGGVFIVLELKLKKQTKRLNRQLDQMSDRQAALIGLVQALAVVPGVSRSGIVMVGMMGLGYRRDEAARYSFLLAVPTILAASGYDLFKMRGLLMHSGQSLSLLLIGTLAAFVVAYFVMKWFIGFLQKNTLIPFGIYRIALAIILLLFLK